MRLFRRGDNHDDRYSGRERALSRLQLRGDWLLVGDQEPPLGSHLVTPRRGYLHHGIYVGARKVVHYSGLAHGLRRGPVEEVPFAHFACGQRVWVRSDAPSDFDVREVEAWLAHPRLTLLATLRLAILVPMSSLLL